MNWKEYTKIKREVNEKIRKSFIEYKKHLLEELKDLEVSVTMDFYLRLQKEVPLEERRKVLAKKQFAKSRRHEE